MKYTMTTPCSECPFLAKFRDSFSREKLEGFASGAFPCHRSAAVDEEEGSYVATPDSVHCAGALIYLEKRDRPHQMMRICERLGLYDRTKLDMTVLVL